jgi:hypothetical protein
MKNTNNIRTRGVSSFNQKPGFKVPIPIKHSLHVMQDWFGIV